MTEANPLQEAGCFLRTRIAAVHQAHRWGVFRCDDGYARTCCRCQWRELADGPTHAEHVADAVIAELRPQLAAWARMCVDGGDMTPMAQRMLHNILGHP